MPEDNRPPLGPPSILAPPAGWLGFLGIKNGGRQPLYSLRDLQTTLEMAPFYRAGNRNLLFGPGPGVAAIQNGLTVFTTVPQGKIWLVESFSIVSVAALGAVANVIAFANITDASAGSGAVIASPPSFGGQRALTGEKVNARMDTPFVAMPGSSFNALTVAAAAPTAFSYFAFIFGQEVSA